MAGLPSPAHVQKERLRNPMQEDTANDPRHGEGLIRVSTNQPFVFDCHPTLAQDCGKWLCAWLQCQSGSDVVVAKALSSSDQPVALSSPPATAGPPQLCVTSSGVLCAWESCLAGKWQLQMKRYVNGRWLDGPCLPVADAHRCEPTLGVGPDGREWCAWVEWDGARRHLKAADLTAPEPRAVEVRPTDQGCYRALGEGLLADAAPTWKCVRPTRDATAPS